MITIATICTKRLCVRGASTDYLDKPSHLTVFCAWDSSLHFTAPLPPARLDPWQLSLKYSNLATELPSDSVAQLISCLPGGGFESLPDSLSFYSPLYFSFHFLTFLSHWLWLRLRSNCQVCSILRIWTFMCLALCACCTPPNTADEAWYRLGSGRCVHCTQLCERFATCSTPRVS